jgi:HlyD family secretion protein
MISHNGYRGRIAMSKRRTTLVFILGLIIVAAVFMRFATKARVEPPARGMTAGASEDKRWQAVAPGRVEPCSGQIKVATAVIGLVDKVLVKANDAAFAGEPLIHLADDELRARLAAAEAQVAVRKRARNEKGATGQAFNRRKAQDSVADAEESVYDARSAVDQAAADLRANGGHNGSLTAARSALARARGDLTKRQQELRTIEDDNPLLTALEGQLSIARAEYAVARSALDKMTVRAPIDGTVLQINIRAGELASPASVQPPLLLANLSALCVRAELDERDLGSIKVRQPASVRTAAFPAREFEGSVSSIAPLVEPGRLEPPGMRNQTEVDVVQVMVELMGSDQLTVGMKADVYFRFGQVSDR